jgi:hypothetical protein
VVLVTFVSGQLDELGEDAVSALRMDEGHARPARAYPRLLVYELNAVLFELFKRGFQVLYLKSDVVKAFATLL